MDGVPTVGSILTVRTGLCRNHSGARLKPIGAQVTLTVLGVGGGAIRVIAATANEDSAHTERFIWDDISPGVIEVTEFADRAT
jgi:hypothetical protein